MIGDARCQTDSLYAWGCGNALMAAAAVSDAIADHPADEEAQALPSRPRWTRSWKDAMRTQSRAIVPADRVLRGESRWVTMDSGIGLIDGVLLPAADHDADVYRAVYRWDLQLDPAAISRRTQR